MKRRRKIFEQIYETVCSNQQKENGTERMSGRNLSRRNFGGRGGRGFKTIIKIVVKSQVPIKLYRIFTFYDSSAKQASDYKNTALFVSITSRRISMEAIILSKLYGSWNTKIRITGIQF